MSDHCRGDIQCQCARCRPDLAAACLRLVFSAEGGRGASVKLHEDATGYVLTWDHDTRRRVYAFRVGAFHCDPSRNDTLAPYGVMIQDDGRWAACPACAPLVRAGDLAGTVARALAGFPEEMHEFAAVALADLHGRFFQHKAAAQN